MRHMYWRPRRVSRTTLALIAVASIAGLTAVERNPSVVREPFFRERMKAARCAKSGFETLKAVREKQRIAIDKDADPAESGMLGSAMSEITSNPGSLKSKRTATNPNFAALIIHYLKRVGVEKGDVVAVGYSGSFPSINVAVVCALETLEVKPVIVSSVASSQWGANIERFDWLVMEDALKEAGLISFRSVAASVGGVEDRALGMSKRGQQRLQNAIKKSGLAYIAPEGFEEGIELRMNMYRQHAGDQPVKAYINVGGGTVSVGRKAGKKMFRPGLNRRLPAGESPDSVMTRFMTEEVPVIHMTEMRKLAERYGFPVEPATIPPVGEGKIFKRQKYNKLWVGLLLAFIMGSLYLFVRSDLGFRMTRGGGGKKSGGDGQPEPMV